MAAAQHGHGRRDIACHDAVPCLHAATPGPNQRSLVKRTDRQQRLHMAYARLAEPHTLQQLMCIFGQIGACRITVTHIAGFFKFIRSSKIPINDFLFFLFCILIILKG
jgi:hypothetical protein